ncbi:MAG: hypothetical protein IIW10_04655 [Spirochaetaceae bacterium]|nr:hypothetical protein [Spirochaetaceae bacterium]
MKNSAFAVAPLSAFLGLSMCFAPEGFIKVSVILGGISAVVSGITKIATLSTLWPSEGKFRLIVLAEGIVGIASGILAVVLPLTVFNTVWNIFLYILGFYLIAAAVLTVGETIQWKKVMGKNFEAKPKVIEIISYVIAATVFFIIPGSVGTTLIRILGASIALFGLGVFLFHMKYFPNVFSVIAEFRKS